MDFKVENITLSLLLLNLSLVVLIVEFSQIKIDHFLKITDNYNSSQTYSVDLDRFQTRTRPHSAP